MKSKKGFQLSINMLVVIILGLVILGVGVTIFLGAYNHVTDLRSDVDQQTASRINSLLDDGSLIVIPFSSKDGTRGDFVDFNMGINNELGNTYKFSVLITYAGSSAYPSESDPFTPIDINNLPNYLSNGLSRVCTNSNTDNCGTDWVLKFDNTYLKYNFEIKNNARALVPIRIVIPKKNVLKGQYIFNVDVCYNMTTSDSKCVVAGGKIVNRFASREKLYINI